MSSQSTQAVYRSSSPRVTVIPCREPTNGAEVVVHVLEHIGQDKGPQAHGLGPHASRALHHSLSKSGSIRLKDALMVAHMMQHEATNQEVCSF